MLNTNEKQNRINEIVSAIKNNLPKADKVIVTVEHATGDGVYDIDLFEAFVSFPENCKLTEDTFETMNRIADEQDCTVDTVNSYLFYDNKDRKEYITVCF